MYLDKNTNPLHFPCLPGGAEWVLEDKIDLKNISLPDPRLNIDLSYIYDNNDINDPNPSQVNTNPHVSTVNTDLNSSQVNSNDVAKYRSQSSSSKIRSQCLESKYKYQDLYSYNDRVCVTVILVNIVAMFLLI